MLKSLFPTALAALFAVPALASGPGPAMTQYAEVQVADWLLTADVIAAIQAQNARNANISATDIETMDQSWRAEVGAHDTPLITSVLGTDVSTYLNYHVALSGGVIREVFVMDEHGLNVASSGVTSDYWQGDEAKFQQTHGVGAGAVHVGDVEFDESTQTYQGQVSLSVTDPATGALIGAVTFGLNAESFF